MKNKKIILFIISILIVLVILISITIFKSFNNHKIFLQNLNNITNEITDKLKYETISGNAKLKLNVGSNLRKENIIIDNVDYNATYQIDLKRGYINIDNEGNYNNELLKSNIYISNNKINILLTDIFNKNITYDIEYLNILNNISDYNQIITTLTNELSNTLKPKYIKSSKVELNNEKVTKFSLDLTKESSKELKDTLIKALSKNKEFMNSLSNINDNKYTNDELISKMKAIDISDYNITFYVTNKSNEFIKVEFKINDIYFSIERKDNKYQFKYYLRDGLLYDGYIKAKDNTISEFNLTNALDNYCINLKFDELNIKYDEKVDNYKELTADNSIKSTNLTEIDKNIIKSNNAINNIYNNYLNRYYQEESSDDDSSASEAMEPIIME